MKNKIIGLTCSLVAISILGEASVQVLPRVQSSGERFGNAIGDGFNRGFSAGLAEKQRIREQERLQKEHEKKIAREKAILEKILIDYEPSKYSEYILKVVQSDLSNETKALVSNILKEQHELYLEQNKQKKGIWPWFQK